MASNSVDIVIGPSDEFRQRSLRSATRSRNASSCEPDGVPGDQRRDGEGGEAAMGHEDRQESDRCGRDPTGVFDRFLGTDEARLDEAGVGGRGGGVSQPDDDRDRARPHDDLTERHGRRWESPAGAGK